MKTKPQSYYHPVLTASDSFIKSSLSHIRFVGYPEYPVFRQTLYAISHFLLWVVLYPYSYIKALKRHNVHANMEDSVTAT